MSTAKKFGICVTPVLLAMLVGPARGQQSPDDQPPPPPQQQQPPQQQWQGRGGPGAFHQRIMADLKERLGASDAEFRTLQPKIEQVMRLQREAGRVVILGPGRGPAGPGGPGGLGGPPRPQGNRPVSPAQQTASDLLKTIDNTNASPQEIQAGLESLRQARTKANDELANAQADLKQVLTARQEALLVTMGMLE